MHTLQLLQHPSVPSAYDTDARLCVLNDLPHLFPLPDENFAAVIKALLNVFEQSVEKNPEPVRLASIKALDKLGVVSKIHDKYGLQDEDFDPLVKEVLDRLLKIFENPAETQPVFLASGDLFQRLSGKAFRDATRRPFPNNLVLDRLFKIFENPAETQRVFLASGKLFEDLIRRRDYDVLEGLRLDVVIDRLLKIFEDGEEAEDVRLQSSRRFYILRLVPDTATPSELVLRMMDRLLKVFENGKELEMVRIASSVSFRDASTRLPQGAPGEGLACQSKGLIERVLAVVENTAEGAQIHEASFRLLNDFFLVTNNWSSPEQLELGLRRLFAVFQDTEQTQDVRFESGKLFYWALSNPRSYPQLLSLALLSVPRDEISVTIQELLKVFEDPSKEERLRSVSRNIVVEIIHEYSKPAVLSEGLISTLPGVVESLLKVFEDDTLPHVHLRNDSAYDLLSVVQLVAADVRFDSQLLQSDVVIRRMRKVCEKDAAARGFGFPSRLHPGLIERLNNWTEERPVP